MCNFVLYLTQNLFVHSWLILKRVATNARIRHRISGFIFCRIGKVRKSAVFIVWENVRTAGQDSKTGGFWRLPY